MIWVSWLGRARPTGPDRSDAAQERFAAAIMRDLPSEVTRQVSAPRPMRERSTGIAVRPSQKPARRGRTPTTRAALPEPLASSCSRPETHLGTRALALVAG